VRVRRPSLMKSSPHRRGGKQRREKLAKRELRVLGLGKRKMLIL